MEHKEKGVDFTWDNNNGIRTLKRSLVGAAVGGGLSYAYYRYQISQEANLPLNSDDYVKKILTEEHLKANPVTYNNVVAYRENLKQ